MNLKHGMRTIIGFTCMIGVGLGVLYFIDNAMSSQSNNGIRSVNAGAGCAAKRTC
jgi:hypothetical protein